ncbi:MAG: hypothetical protein PHS04_11670 [Tissierellia bacterium]|nr:hypothetical protein [Tissierellia bacterium]
MNGYLDTKESEEYSRFQLYIFHKGQEYREILIDSQEIKHDLPLFGVYNALVNVQKAVPEQGTKTEYANRILSRVRDNLQCKSLAHELSWVDLRECPIAFKYYMKDAHPDHIEGFRYLAEFLGMSNAFKLWLSPQINKLCKTKKYLLPSDSYCENIKLAGGIDYAKEVSMIAKNIVVDDVEDIVHYWLLLAYEAVGCRSKEVTAELIAIDAERKESVYTGRGERDNRYVTRKTVLSKLYTSRQGLLPLIWAEISFAVEHDIYAGFCEVCGSAFPYINHRFNKKVCSSECAKKKTNDKLQEKDPEFNKRYQNLRQAKARAKTQQEKDSRQKEIDKLLRKWKPGLQ